MPNEKKTSIRYSILRQWIKLGLHVYFRDIEVVGKEKVPAKGPVIFAVNHPNTVLDALLTACFSPRKPWFMARGDVFNNKFLAGLFRVMRMLPVFREKDGTAAVKKNTEVFSLASRIIAKGDSLILFPEGSHNRQWKIRDLRRGLSRIAQESVERNPELMVVPVGITYFDPMYSFSDVLIQFGDPILAKDFLTKDDHPVQQQNALIKEVGKQLEELTLHIGNADYEDIYNRVKFLEQHAEDSKTLLEDFTRLKAWITGAQDDPQLGKTPEEELLTKVKRKGLPLIALIVTSPIWLTGKILTVIPQFIIWVTVNRLKDDHFTGSVKFGIGLVCYTTLFIGLGIWSRLESQTVIGFFLQWGFFTFCMFFVMLWEEHFQNFRDQRFN